MIKKSDIHQLQEKIAKLTKEGVAARIAHTAAMRAAQADMDALRAKMGASEQRAADVKNERKYLVEQAETYKAQAESRLGIVEREREAAAKAKADFDALKVNLRKAEADLAKAQKAAKASQEKAETFAAALRQSRADADRDAKAAAADIKKQHDKTAKISGELREAKAERTAAKAQVAKMERTALRVHDEHEKEIAALCDQVAKANAKPAPAPAKEVVTITAYEREPSDIAEIERLTRELAKCRSGQAGE